MKTYSKHEIKRIRGNSPLWRWRVYSTWLDHGACFESAQFYTWQDAMDYVDARIAAEREVS